MKTLISAATLLLISLNVYPQVSIKFDKVYNGQAFFTILDENVVQRIENGEKLYIWGWSSHQIDTLSDGGLFINGYNSNFYMTSSTTFKSSTYWKLPLAKPCWVWATFDQPFGHRPPPMMHLAVNKVEFQNYSYGLPTLLEDYLSPISSIWQVPVQSKSVNMYPNPTKGNITIELNSDYSNMKIIVNDATNRAVKFLQVANGKSIPLSLSHLDRGVYLIQVIIDGENVTRKIILN